MLYAISGSPLRTLPAAMSHSAQVVFSRTDTDILYFCDANELRRYVVSRSVHELVHVFPEYSTLVVEHAEGDLSEDGDHLALCGKRPDGVEEVFVYSLTLGKQAIFPQAEPFDGLKISGSHPILSKESGIWDLETGRRLTEVNGHACVGLHDGNHVLCYCTAADPQENANAVRLVQIESGESWILATFDWAYAMQLTAGPDCVYAGLYDPKGERLSQLWKLPYNASAGTLLHEWKSVYRGYESSPRPTYDQGLLLFTVDDGKQTSVWGLKLDEPKPERPFIRYAPGKVYPLVTQPKCPTCGSELAGFRESE